MTLLGMSLKGAPREGKGAPRQEKGAPQAPGCPPLPCNLSTLVYDYGRQSNSSDHVLFVWLSVQVG